MSEGILIALVAMFCWGFGDFLIQRSTRKIGDGETLFLITAFGAIVLLPFVWKDLGMLLNPSTNTFWILIGASALLFVAALFEFEALKKGKLSVIEPTWSLEIPASAILAVLILNESLEAVQVLFIITLVLGLILISYRGEILNKKFFFEKGVKISILAAILMGATNFFVGWGARETDPLAINFFISAFSALGSLIFLISRRKVKKTFADLLKYPKTIVPMMLLDNMAWISFALAMTLAPIAITVAFSESYIIIAVILGLFIGREKLEEHQKIGLIISVISAIALAVFL